MRHYSRYLLIFAVFCAAVGCLISIGASAKNDAITKADFSLQLAKKFSISPVTVRFPCFKDLSVSDPATATICGLKKAKILKGTSATLFRPNSPVTFAFALQSVCSANKWTQTPSFSSCNKIQQKNYLFSDPEWKDVKGPTILTQKQIDSIIEKSAKLKELELHKVAAEPQEIPERSSALIPARKLPTLSFTPVNDGTIATNFFTNITLDSALPRHFYLDEVYMIEGSYTGTEKELFAFLCKESHDCSSSKNFIAQIKNSRFKIPVHFTEAGNFELGIIPGRSGQSVVEKISVLPTEPTITQTAQTKPTELRTSYEKGKARFSWNSTGTITRLVVFQNDSRHDYIFRQPIQFYEPNSKDFAAFKKGAAGWFVETDSVQSEVQNISLITQEFRTVDESGVNIYGLTETYPAPSKFNFSGKALVQISKKAVITLPNGTVTDVIFASSDITPQKDFNVEYDLKSPGTYIFEVNNPLGGAVINIPIYVGNALPLLPDFFSRNTPKLVPGDIADIHVARKTMLDLINKDRATLDLPPVKLSTELSNIAQLHSADMVARNFFGHTNPSGQGPDDRRKAAGFPTPIRENLGKAASIDFVEAGLMRSPIHRDAIIDPAMTQVGIGMAKDVDGYYLVTQNFSSDTITTDSAQTYEITLIEIINQARSESSLTQLSVDSKLNQAADEWSSRMAKENFFDMSDPNGTTLIQVVRNKGVTSSFQLNIVGAGNLELLKQEMLKQDGISNSGMKKMGLGLAVSSNGDLLLTTLYAP